MEVPASPCAIGNLFGQRLSVGHGAAITLAAGSIGVVAGGAPAVSASSYRWARSAGLGTDGALLVGSLPSFLNNAILLLLAFAGMLYLLIAHKLSVKEAVLFGFFAAVVATVLLAALWGSRRRPEVTQTAHRLAAAWSKFRHRAYDPSPVDHWVEELWQAGTALVRRSAWRGPLAGSLTNIGFDMLTLYFLFRAAGNPVPIAFLVVGYGMPLLFAKVGFLPGGVGLVEGTMSAIYGSLGVPAPIAVVVVLTYRIVSFWLPTLVGFVCVLVLNRRTAAAASSA